MFFKFPGKTLKSDQQLNDYLKALSCDLSLLRAYPKVLNKSLNKIYLFKCCFIIKYTSRMLL